MAESLHEMAKRWLAEHFITNTLDTMYLFCEALRIGVDDDLRAWAAANPARTYRDDFFEKFPNAPRGGKGYERYPFANLYTVYPVCKAKDKELYCDTSDTDAWDKPLGYWDAPLGTWGEKGDENG